MFTFKRFVGDNRGAMVDRIAIGAAVIGISGLVTANVLSHKLEKGDLPIVAFLKPDQGMKRLAKSAPTAQPAAPHNVAVSFVRGVGMDAGSTATVARPNAPCADAKAGLPNGVVSISRSVGVDGVVTTTLSGAKPAAPCGDAEK
jgi:hypothetical protein